MDDTFKDVPQEITSDNVKRGPYTIINVADP